MLLYFHSGIAACCCSIPVRLAPLPPPPHFIPQGKSEPITAVPESPFQLVLILLMLCCMLACTLLPSS